MWVLRGIWPTCRLDRRSADAIKFGFATGAPTSISKAFSQRIENSLRQYERRIEQHVPVWRNRPVARPMRKTFTPYTWIGYGILPTFPGLADQRPAADLGTFHSDHSAGVVQFVLADGSVRKVSPQIDYAAYIILGGMHDGMRLATVMARSA